MRKFKYLGGSWTDTDNHYHNAFIIGNVYTLLNEDHHYCFSHACYKVYFEKKYFEEVKEMKLIHDPCDIVRGKLYKTKDYYGSTLYLGCTNRITNRKYLVIVMDEPDIGYEVIYPSSLWNDGFEEQ